MKSSPKIGAAAERQFIVEQKHVIDFATDGMPAVLSTPNLIGLLERTARKSLEPFLEPDDNKIGATEYLKEKGREGQNLLEEAWQENVVDPMSQMLYQFEKSIENIYYFQF